jgi:DNA repair protein RecN (Recombination protein N)
VARTLQDYAEGLEFNPQRLQEVEERLELIANLKRKYGDTIEQVVAFGTRVQAELSEIGNWEGRTTHLEQQEEQLLRQIGQLGQQLSGQRRTAGEQLARQVEAGLADLRMTRARFGVAIEQQARTDGALLPDGRRVAFDATGIDHVEFLISANPGEPLKPMAKVASGGETARLMLALKSTLAHADATPTLIFDEIDQGIGGRVGAIVGQKLWLLTGAQVGLPADGPQHQVLCITHLPQLAAFGDQHFTVNKQVVAVNGEERTRTTVQQLDGAARLDELVQMLGATGEAGRKSVEEMVAEVGKAKQGARLH